MGNAYVTATRIFKNGPNGDPLYLETLPQIGYQRTHSENSTVTDSAAAASAWASGEKYLNGQISCHDTDMDYICDALIMPTILELAQDAGKATGLVATSTITHATPASFGSHVHVRKCETEIARQYVEDTGVDILLGGGIGPDTSSCKTPSSKTAAQIIDDAQSVYGYAYAVNKAEMDAAVASEKMKILGLFTPGGKTPETYRVDPVTYTWPSSEPTLPEMTEAALDILEEDNDGFFLMVEGSQIDWSGHANDKHYLIGETLAFDESVQVVLNWIAEEPSRANHTLLIIVADHETGGFMINGPYGVLAGTGDVIDAGWTSGGHTGEDTIIWSQGPGSEYLGKALDNTDLYWVMQDVLK
jgi:alkaline phosphatase